MTVVLEGGCRTNANHSRLKRLWTETCTETNFCRFRICRQRSIARLPRRNGRCEVSARRANAPSCNHPPCRGLGLAAPLQSFSGEFQRRPAITGPGDEAFQPFPLMIDGPPEAACHAHDLREDLVEAPPTCRRYGRSRPYTFVIGRGPWACLYWRRRSTGRTDAATPNRTPSPPWGLLAARPPRLRPGRGRDRAAHG